jgi:alpha-aminoadipate/glutamate carrier protein LysW
VLPQCPDCAAAIEIDELDVDLGEIISCPECGADLQVLGVSPLELDVAHAVESVARVARKDA